MAQMKAYTMPMKKCTLLRGPFHLRRLFSKTQMWLGFSKFALNVSEMAIIAWLDLKTDALHLQILMEE